MIGLMNHVTTHVADPARDPAVGIIMWTGNGRRPNKINKLFIPVSPIGLPFSSIAGNTPARKPTRNIIPVSRDYKILSVK